MRAAVCFIAAGLLAAASASYADEAAHWRADYEASLKAPDGWLSVAGLFWLKEGENKITIGAPAKTVAFTLAKKKVFYQGRELKPDSDDKVEIAGVSLQPIERDGNYGIRLRDPNAETRRDFTGCKWFPASESWRIKAKWVPFPEPKKIAITNILGMTDDEPSPGYAEFTLKGQTLRLQPVIEDNELFFLFKDQTTGKTTYPAGRFLYAPIPKGNEVVLDFNQSHNPPCAFTAFATCPLPPRQNTLAIAIEAGELNYGHH
ncbi:MAG TPA: DUF1684 domain-containing protein [Bryobacteraceae bacterium]|nr:DUF1684 domain-containing protein [Bryobacteraceae bacterium]